MKIRYLQEMHDSAVGDVKIVDDVAANVLVLLGVAEQVEEKSAKKLNKTATQAGE